MALRLLRRASMSRALGPDGLDLTTGRTTGCIVFGDDVSPPMSNGVTGRVDAGGVICVSDGASSAACFVGSGLTSAKVTGAGKLRSGNGRTFEGVGVSFVISKTGCAAPSVTAGSGTTTSRSTGENERLAGSSKSGGATSCEACTDFAPGVAVAGSSSNSSPVGNEMFAARELRSLLSMMRSSSGLSRSRKSRSSRAG